MFFVDCLVVYVIYILVLHLTTIPALEEPMVHATVVNNAHAQTPTHRHLRKDVGVSICMVE